MSKTIFITGANSGIGISATELFLSKGWNVAATARDPSAATELSALAKKHPGELFVQAIDLHAPETIQPAVDGAIAKFGRVDVLVNNAGYGLYGPVELLSMDDIQKQFEANVYGPIRLIKAFLAHFHTAPASCAPRIINVSSGAGHFGFPISALYHSSKAALELLTESLSYELAALRVPIAVKLVIPYGGVSGTNFMKNVIPVLSLARPRDGDSAALGVAREDYGVFADAMLAKFRGIAGGSMPATKAAARILEAVEDEQMDKLRYFVGPTERLAAMNYRLEGAREEGENLDEIDERYMKKMRALFQ